MRAFRLAYDGRPFRGFQRQPDVDTVEDALLAACRRLDVPFADDRDTPPGYAAAGRTDAGVSALAQTVAFDAPGYLDPSTLNAELPAPIRAWAAADAPAAFHATHDATRRAYVYHLHAPDARDGLARAACERLSGVHDFHNLTPDETGTERRLSVTLKRDGPFLLLRFVAGGFARQLVRRATSLLADVARGVRPLSFVDRALGPEPLPGPEGVGPAPAPPLVLAAVDYPSLSFTPDAAAAAAAREAFDRRRTDALSAARVATTVRDGLADSPDSAGGGDQRDPDA